MSQYMKAGYTPPKAPKKPRKKPQQRKPEYSEQIRRQPQRPVQPCPQPRVKRPLSVRILRALAVVLALCVVAALAFVIVAYQELSVYQERYFTGVYVDQVHLGGLTREQATTALQSRMDTKLESYELGIVNESGQHVRTLSPQDVGLIYNLEKQLDDAWMVARGGNLIEQMQEARRVRQETVVFDWTLSYDAQLLAQIVSDLAAQMDCEAVDAQASFVPSSAQPFVFTDEQIGAKLDQKDLLTQLEERLSSLSAERVTLSVNTQTPAVTRAQLEANASLRAMVYSDVPASKSNGCENIRLAVEAIGGVMIRPGEAFDFNAIVGKRTASAGYLEAEEVAYGEEVSGIGGGVCQVSTALYQAALTAGLKIVEQHPHVFPADYAPAGQDATVSDQGLNLVFENDTTYPVYLKMRFYEAQDDVMRIETTVFGAPLDAVYSLESVIAQELEIPEAVRVRDKDQTYVTYSDEEEQVGDGRIGYLAQTYRVAWADGIEVSRELAAECTYQPVAPRIYVGTTVRDADGK